MVYGDYLQNISAKFQNLFGEISAEHNFDYGDEFEIALCKVLRTLLPSKFGICRGFAVTLDGTLAGDDILIFDHERFPTLRLLESNDFAQKQRIPIEAVYAYIEAKHTIVLNGDDGQSLSKACKQVEAVKRLPRQSIALNQITPQMQIEMGGIFQINTKPFWPTTRNPMYGAVVARHVRSDAHSSVEGQELIESSRQRVLQIPQQSSAPPDLLVLGQDIVCVPTVGTQIESPFFIIGTSTLATCPTPTKSFAAGMSALSWALDYIELGTILWPAVVAEGLSVPMGPPPAPKESGTDANAAAEQIVGPERGERVSQLD
jgi:hypothetical protein